jgi:uncharacterized membrane protein YeiH
VAGAPDDPRHPSGAAPPAVRPRADRLVLACDLAATTLFALEGATIAVGAHLDLFGVLVVAFATALGGGIVRDVLLGATPPASLEYVRYPVAAFLGGAVVFLFAGPVRDLPDDVVVTLDAAGLSLFAVAGARKALDVRANALTAVLLGVLTAVGGGVLRDVLLSRVPGVLVIDVYASAALVGAAAMVLATRRGMAAGRAMVLGGLLCFGVRMVAHWQHWSLPKVGF